MNKGHYYNVTASHDVYAGDGSDGFPWCPAKFIERCARYQVGQIVYVKEKHYTYGKWIKNGTTKTGKQKHRFVGDFKKPVYYFDTLPDDLVVCKREEAIGYFCRPSIFMPREAARIFLRITDIRCERLQDISVDDCIAEGAISRSQVENMGNYTGGVYVGTLYKAWEPVSDDERRKAPVAFFRELWDSLNAKRDNGAYAWENSPWVWIYSLKRCDKQESEG